MFGSEVFGKSKVMCPLIFVSSCASATLLIMIRPDRSTMGKIGLL
jgi:hypothetical protein